MDGSYAFKGVEIMSDIKNQKLGSQVDQLNVVYVCMLRIKSFCEVL